MAIRISPKLQETLMSVAQPLIFGGVGVFVVDAVNRRLLTEILPLAITRLGIMSVNSTVALGCFPISTTMAIYHLVNKALPHFKYISQNKKLANCTLLVISVGSGMAVAGLTGFILSVPLIQVIFATTVGSASTVLLSTLLDKLLKERQESLQSRKKEQEKNVGTPQTPQKGGASQPSTEEKVDKQEFETYKTKQTGLEQTIQNLTHTLNSLPNFSDFTKKEDLLIKLSRVPTVEEMEKAQRSIRIIQKKLRNSGSIPGLPGNENEKRGDEEDDDALHLRLEKLEKAFGFFHEKIEGQLGLEKQMDEMRSKLKLYPTYNDLSDTLENYSKNNEHEALLERITKLEELVDQEKSTSRLKFKELSQSFKLEFSNILNTMDEKLTNELSKTIGSLEFFREGIENIKQKIMLFQVGLDRFAIKEEVPQKDELDEMREKVEKKGSSLNKLKKSLKSVQEKVEALEKNINLLSNQNKTSKEDKLSESLSEEELLREFQKLKLAFKGLEGKMKRASSDEFILVAPTDEFIQV